jgi:hypothetical protein
MLYAMNAMTHTHKKCAVSHTHRWMMSAMGHRKKKTDTHKKGFDQSDAHGDQSGELMWMREG